MFGVLVVRTQGGEMGFLSAFSGTLDTQVIHDYFVPPVYNLMNPTCRFQIEQKEISEINHRIAEGEMPERDRIELKTIRKQKSRDLQQWIFQQFRFRNARGEEADLNDLFIPKIPPSGAGECCAPRLLQYAYLHQLEPLCMAEWWRGESPKGEVRVEGQYYAACRSKCHPILKHMLGGLSVDPNPLLGGYMQKVEKMKILYEDDVMIVVSKPSGMLSCPGLDDLPSVQSILEPKYSECHRVLIHRLDMDTSGIIVCAKNDEASIALQMQFEKRQVHKRYVAILEKEMTIGEEGEISLPLRPDLDDRPRQMVDFEHGKQARTHYRVLANVDGHAYLILTPLTGRTHQLRVHCAHPQGLANPILGDRLYGTKKASRMMLHARDLTLCHPISGEEIRLCDDGGNSFDIPVEL